MPPVWLTTQRLTQVPAAAPAGAEPSAPSGPAVSPGGASSGAPSQARYQGRASAGAEAGSLTAASTQSTGSPGARCMAKPTGPGSKRVPTCSTAKSIVPVVWISACSQRSWAPSVAWVTNARKSSPVGWRNPQVAT